MLDNKIRMLDIQFIELNAFVTLNNKIYIHLVGDRKFKPNMTDNICTIL